jgi:HAD superfamily hydrolase (TIGR01509 family)
MSPAGRVAAVVFDVGETLVDETRAWEGWADWLDVPRLTFLGLLGAVIARGDHHRAVFELVRPGFDYQAALAARDAAGQPHGFDARDLYPDARGCLAELRRRGYQIGVVGNQPRLSEPALREAALPCDWLGSSERWGLHKPDPRFFARVVEETGLSPDRVAYVGDRLDNDVLPALEAGLVGIFLRRGPWGYLHAERPEVARAQLRLDGLAGLPDALDALG